jgi:hypothetical protein
MNALGITARTVARDLGRFVLGERKGTTRRLSGTGHDVRNEPERSGTSEREPCSSNGTVRA